jgi:hypothetical protein
MEITSIERVKAGDSTVNQCPQCKGVALRQIGDPRLHRGMGIEFRRRACLNDGCGWVGVEMRAIISTAIAAVIEEAIIEQQLMEDAK